MLVIGFSNESSSALAPGRLDRAVVRKTTCGVELELLLKAAFQAVKQANTLHPRIDSSVFYRGEYSFNSAFDLLRGVRLWDSRKKILGLKVFMRPLTLLLGVRLTLVLRTKTVFVHSKLISYLLSWEKGVVQNFIWWAMMLREPELLVRVLEWQFNRANMFSHRRMVRKLQNFLMRMFRRDLAPLVGFIFFIMGKISVGGNARTRSMHTRYGRRGASRVGLNATGSWGNIFTITGCMGFHILLFF